MTSHALTHKTGIGTRLPNSNHLYRQFTSISERGWFTIPVNELVCILPNS